MERQTTSERFPQAQTAGAAVGQVLVQEAVKALSSGAGQGQQELQAERNSSPDGSAAISEIAADIWSGAGRQPRPVLPVREDRCRKAYSMMQVQTVDIADPRVETVQQAILHSNMEALQKALGTLLQQPEGMERPLDVIGQSLAGTNVSISSESNQDSFRLSITAQQRDGSQTQLCFSDTGVVQAFSTAPHGRPARIDADVALAGISEQIMNAFLNVPRVRQIREVDEANVRPPERPERMESLRGESTPSNSDAQMQLGDVQLNTRSSSEPTEQTGGRRRTAEEREDDLRHAVINDLRRQGSLNHECIRECIIGFTWWQQNMQSWESRARQLQDWLNNFNLRPPIRIVIHRGGRFDNTLDGSPIPHEFEVFLGRRSLGRFHLANS